MILQFKNADFTPRTPETYDYHCTLLTESESSTTYGITAAQMWILASILPLMIGDLVPSDDNMWECFMLLPRV